jgi:4-amino-4-deoxy-L-arabinose transferase-like glycosyltransferase
VWPVVGLALVFGLALWLRLIGLGGAVTEDEDQWIARSGTFAQGLETQDWQRTFLTGHPGVTVMWVTSLALGLERAGPFMVVRGGPDVTVIPGFLLALHDARIPFAVLQSVLVVGCAALVTRLFDVGVGLVAGLLFAAEPFWAGVGPIVGMDGPLSGFVTISLLGVMLALRPDIGRRERGAWTVLSGLAFGLACLTKTTALLAGPMVPVLALLAAWQAWRRYRLQGTGYRGRSIAPVTYNLSPVTSAGRMGQSSSRLASDATAPARNAVVYEPDMSTR